MLHTIMSEYFPAWGWDEHTVITLNILIQYPASTLVGAVCHPNATYVKALGLETGT